MPITAYDKYGYDWCWDNWGTKWNARRITVKDDGSIQFLTAWTPPIQVVIKMSEKFPLMFFKLEYCSFEDNFIGTYECQNGILFKDELRTPLNEEIGSSNELPDYKNMETKLLSEFKNKGTCFHARPG